MPIETSVTVIADLNASYPATTDAKALGANHLQNIKTAVKSLSTASSSAGAAQVGFLAAGSNTTARTVQDKQRERITPADFSNTTTGANATGKVYEIPNATYGGIDYGHGLVRDLQTTPVRSALEHREVTNSVVTAAVPYAIRYAFYNRSANLAAASGQEVADALICRFNSISNGGSVWGRWDVMTTPLPLGSGLTGAPSVAQSYSALIAEYNPQNRTGDYGSWTPERRITTNWVGGIQIVPETLDFTSTLGTTRIGYHATFAWAVTQSGFTANYGGTYSHARSYNGYLIEPNAIAPGGMGYFATGHKDFASAVSAINAAGSGYVVGDVLTLSDGLSVTLNQSAKLKVLTVNGSGGVTSAEVYVAGQYFTTPTFPCAVTGGTGSAATFTLTMESASSNFPRAVLGVSGKWLYGIDFCPNPTGRYASVTNSFLRVPNAVTAVCGRNAADSADIALLGINSSDQPTLAGQRVITPATWVPTVSAGSGTFTTVAVDSARYSQVNGVVHFRLQIHVTTKGTAAGSLKFTLPVAAGSSASVFSGANTNDNVALTCVLASGGATTISCTKYDGSDPLADGKFYVIAGSYEAAS